MQGRVFWRSAAAFQPKPERSKMEVCLWGYCFFPCGGFLCSVGIVWKATAQNDPRVTREDATPLMPKQLWLSEFGFGNGFSFGGWRFKLHLFQQVWLWKPLKKQTMLPHSVKLWADLLPNHFLDEEGKVAAAQVLLRTASASKYPQVKGEIYHHPGSSLWCHTKCTHLFQ